VLNDVVPFVVVFQKSKLYLNESSTVIFRRKLIHDHEEPTYLLWKIISNSAKRKAADQAGIYRPLKINKEEIVKASAELTQLLNSDDINRIWKIINHKYRKNHQVLPKSLNDTHDTILTNYKLKQILMKIFYWVTILLTTL